MACPPSFTVTCSTRTVCSPALRYRSEHVSLDAAIATLGINGIRATGDVRPVNVSVDLSVGYVLDLREPGDKRPLHQIEGTAVEPRD